MKNHNVLVTMISELTKTKGAIMEKIKENEELIKKLPDKIEKWVELEKTMKAAAEMKEKEKKERQESKK